MVLYKCFYKSPIGKILIVSDSTSLIGLWLEGQKHYGETLKNNTIIEEETPILNKTKKWLDSYFLGSNPKIEDLKLNPIGSPFRKRVWEILCKIPYGKTITYGDIAKKLSTQDKEMSAQAIGGAISHNQILIIIPCHRVIGAGGNLTGFAAGIDKKIRLLKLEKVETEKLYTPNYIKDPIKKQKFN